MEFVKSKSTFVDKLKIEGINSQGFGIIPKYIMLDTELPIESKAIYAYFCSFSGNGTISFPSRSKIIYDLQINKDTYYKYLNILINHGYINVQQRTNKQGEFESNIYTLVSNPKKVQLSMETELEKGSSVRYERIRVSGIKGWGYGMIPKAVMVDQRLPIKAKGIYAYFAAYSGAGGGFFPKKNTIQFHLKISEPTYYKFYSLLTKLNYITAVQRHVEGRLQINDYILNDAPDEEAVLKNSRHGGEVENTVLKNFGHGGEAENTVLKNFGHGREAENTVLKNFGHGGEAEIQYLKISDMVKQDTVKQDAVNSDTNSNSIKSNSIKNNTHSYVTQKRV